MIRRAICTLLMLAALAVAVSIVVSSLRQSRDDEVIRDLEIHRDAMHRRFLESSGKDSDYYYREWFSAQSEIEARRAHR